MKTVIVKDTASIEEKLHQLVSCELGVDGFEAVVDRQWCSQNGGHRGLLRHAIFTRFDGDETTLDLREIPQLNGRSLSISHCREVGGFCVADSNGEASIGFDVEQNARVDIRHIERVSDSEEIHTAPTLSALWTAKEAAFKCLFGPGQPRGVKDVKISSWLGESGYYRFNVSSPVKLSGVCIEENGLTYAVCASAQGKEQGGAS